MMRLITWNINGIRAALSKGALEWAFAQRPQVLCLQEVKARPEQVDETQRIRPGYQVFWNAAERPGYSGVVTYSSLPPLEVEFGLGEERFDREGRVIRTRYPEFLLYNIYFPNGQRGRERVEYKLDFYARLLSICDDLHARGEKIVIAGDFNTAHQPIDLKHPEENENTSGFLPEEREWVQRFLDHGFVDAYRRLYPGRVQYTWWTYRFGARRRGIGWRIDYFLVSEGLFSLVKDVIIHEEVPGSDHCPVELVLDT